jgi:hypothetical protein
MGDRWHRHQNAGDHEEDPGIQPTANTTSHNPHLPPRTHRGVDEDSSRPRHQMGPRARAINGPLEPAPPGHSRPRPAGRSTTTSLVDASPAHLPS